MAENFQTDPSFSILNNGQPYNATDGLSAEDLNKIVENLQYLYLHGGEEVDLLKVYPIDSYFITENTQSTPAAMFGGSWVKVKDRFLLGQGDSYVLGSEGGSSTVTLTADQIPSHNHTETISNGNWAYDMVYNAGGTSSTYSGGAVSESAFNVSAKGNKAYTSNTGGGQSHNNMPPYRVVNIWRRTA